MSENEKNIIRQVKIDNNDYNIYAEYANSAAEAIHATSADSASVAESATQDASGNIITSTYETKGDAKVKFDEVKLLSETNLELAKSHAEEKDTALLSAAQSYTDNALTQKSQVQFIIWEADD